MIIFIVKFNFVFNRLIKKKNLIRLDKNNLYILNGD